MRRLSCIHPPLFDCGRSLRRARADCTVRREALMIGAFSSLTNGGNLSTAAAVAGPPTLATRRKCFCEHHHYGLPALRCYLPPAKGDDAWPARSSSNQAPEVAAPVIGTATSRCWRT